MNLYFAATLEVTFHAVQWSWLLLLLTVVLFPRLADGGTHPHKQQLQRRNVFLVFHGSQFPPDRLHRGDREAAAQVPAAQIQVWPGWGCSQGRRKRRNFGRTGRKGQGEEQNQLPWWAGRLQRGPWRDPSRGLPHPLRRWRLLPLPTPWLRIFPVVLFFLLWKTSPFLWDSS